MVSNLLSVIVPIYNVESLLPKCIESIINQTYTNLEIILVDDGSSDNCGFICDKYAQKDKRIRVIHKKNGGLSDARNAGLLSAKGEYVSFVDSDDYIANNAYEILMHEAIENKLDIVASNALVINGGEKFPLMKKKTFSEEIISGIEYMTQSINQNAFQACAWLNLYKRNLLINNNIYFEKGLLHEDEEWTPRVFLEATRVKYIDFNMYNYVIREGSITTKKDKSKNALDIIKTCYKLEIIYQTKVTKSHRKILNDYLLNIFLGAIYMGRLDRITYKKFIKKSFVFGKANNVHSRIKAILLLINMKLYCELNKLSKRKG